MKTVDQNRHERLQQIQHQGLDAFAGNWASYRCTNKNACGKRYKGGVWIWFFFCHDTAQEDWFKGTRNEMLEALEAKAA